MDWAMVSAIGELISALAVVLSLAYVGRQIHQNTAAMKSSALLGLSRGSFDLSLEGTRPAMAATLLKAFGEMAAPARDVGRELGLEPEETIQLALYFNAMLRDAESRWRHSQLREFGGSFEQFGGGSSLYQTPGFRALWPTLRRQVGEDFAAFLEAYYDLGDREAGRRLAEAR